MVLIKDVVQFSEKLIDEQYRSVTVYGYGRVAGVEFVDESDVIRSYKAIQIGNIVEYANGGDGVPFERTFANNDLPDELRMAFEVTRIKP